MKEIQEQIFQSKEFEALAEHAEALQAGERLVIRGVAGSILAFVLARAFEQKPVLVIASDEEGAEKLRDDCALLVGEGYVRFFGARPAHHAQALDMTSSIAQIETLKTLAAGNRLLVVAFPQSILEKVPPPENFARTIIELKTNHEHMFQDLLSRLEELGFVRKNFVESYGDVAVRGGIIDIFPYVGENPIRFEFWGNTIESIREFDVLSQRSIRELQSASIVPTFIADNSNETDKKILSASLFDYLKPDTIVILDEPVLIEREVEEIFIEGPTNLFTYENVIQFCARFPTIMHSMFSLNQSAITNPQSAISFDSVSQPSFNGSINRLVAQLQQLSANGYRIYLTSDTKEEGNRLQELIEEAITATDDESRFRIQDSAGESEDNPLPEPVSHISYPVSHIKPEFIGETLHSGFIYPSAHLAIFTEHEIFGRLKRRGLPKRRRFKGFSQKELQQLRRGDFVVHADHGIGVFDGLKKITVGGAEQEVMKVLFLENDVLYVNLNFINRVQKYSSQEGHVPRLNKLGAPEWERVKARAKKRIKDIARDLQKLYARRKHEQGFSFSSDTHWQKELEASFMYEDTPDQASATLAVKQDMENIAPMDRLVCGDVGFGKTEVAVRAAFKAVMDGKQVAVLVPTTILALQHFNTFHDRLSRYTTRIENLTRFKSKRAQQSTVEALKKGSVDIIIGTHRLLSKDIAFKDLGLLIIDEEHRFGVSSKEKLRQLKAAVDTLSLTATPIPRTLHFSLMGARDLSLINTPPRNRLPIITEIIPGSDGRQAQWHLIREAVLKELHRGGQVYFVHDRVQNIDVIADHLRSHIPEARVHAAHGQMPGHELEKTMLDFLERKYDVLVATKIIESGLDIPSVNTIIINRADRFGLAELYQLRGRVGRSNIQAHAYLLVPPLGVLPKQTLRRLQAIEEFTELGSGFNLAMRDMEIRGAGNIFGAEQSGFIIEMGFEMYERIVREAVDELKQEEFNETFEPNPQSSTRNPQSTETVIDADIEALIPDFYIESDSERLDIYRRLYRATSGEDLQTMRDELRDRFGEYPEEVDHLFQLVELRLIASRAEFPKISLKGSILAVTLPSETHLAFYGSPDDQNTPFQQIMKQIADGILKNTRLEQVGKELTLQTRLTVSDDVRSGLKEAKSKLLEIASISGILN